MQIPENTVTQKDLETWYELQENLKKIKVSEMFLRKKIFDALFPNPVEGTNSFTLPDGFVVKGGYSLDRKVDPATLTACKELLEENGIRSEHLVKWDPSLKKAEYNKLTDEQQKIFDQVLIIKPGSPSLEIVLPKRKS
jgi:hypothetical protein